MGGFNVYDRVEGVCFIRQIPGVALHEVQAVNAVSLPAKANSAGVEVQCCVALRLKSARKVGGSATVAAAHFQYLFPPQRHLRCDMMIKLDAGTIGFVVSLEGDAHRRIFFVSIVEEENHLAAESPGEKRIPKPPEGLANQTDGKKAINDWHGKQLRQTLSDANLVLALLSVENRCANRAGILLL